ncbi:MAG: hypothetical protein ACI9KE_000339 [Polyangiales bacterium]|jgi:hypothetical protein
MQTAGTRAVVARVVGYILPQARNDAPHQDHYVVLSGLCDTPS